MLRYVDDLARVDEFSAQPSRSEVVGLPDNGWAQRKIEPELLNGFAGGALVPNPQDFSPFPSGKEAILLGEERLHNLERHSWEEREEERMTARPTKRPRNASTMETSQVDL